MSAQDYIKFLIEKLTIRTTKKVKREGITHQGISFFSSHWLGVLPFAFKTLFKKM